MRETDCRNRIRSAGNPVTSLPQRFFATRFILHVRHSKRMLRGVEQVIYPLRTSDSLAPPLRPTYMLPNKLWVINNHYSNRVLISRGEICMIKKNFRCTFPSDLHKAGHWPEHIDLYSFLPALGWLVRDLNTVSARHKSPLNPRQILCRQNSRLQNQYNNTTTCSQKARE
jgi:hypothetical protein